LFLCRKMLAEEITPINRIGLTRRTFFPYLFLLDF